MDESTGLEFIFSNVNHWLEHAERKNTFIFSAFSLISLSSIVGTIQTYTSFWIKIGSIVTIVIYLFSLLFTLFLLFPITRFSKSILENGEDRKLKLDDNLLFYGDIVKYSADEYRQKISEKYSLNFEKGVHKDLIKQIIVNSYITNNKYKCFKISSILLFIAILQFSILFSFSLFN